MVWFVCDDCGDTIKKPKVPQHLQQCSASRFTCLDCSRSFDRHTVKGHATCVTEVDKYAKGATKPGGYAAQGFFKGPAGATVPAVAQLLASTSQPDTAFLSTRPPWSCSICKVTCTSQDTLLGHAQGVKHQRRARAAAKDLKGSVIPNQETPPVPQAAETVSESLGEKRAAAAIASAAADELPPEAKRSRVSGASLNDPHVAYGSIKSADTAVANSDVVAVTAEQQELAIQKLQKIKWKKLAMQILKQHNKALKLSKLQKQLRLLAHVTRDMDADADVIIASRLKGSSQFTVKGKSVSLASV